MNPNPLTAKIAKPAKVEPQSKTGFRSYPFPDFAFFAFFAVK